MRRAGTALSESTEPTLSEILDLLESPRWQNGSCAVCLLARQSVARTLKAFFAEFVNDPPARSSLRSSRGFCESHTRLVTDMGDSLGAAIVCSDLAVETIERWRRGGRALRKEPAHCPACGWEQEAEHRYVSAIAAGLANSNAARAVSNRDCLCGSHVEQIASLAPAEHGAPFLAAEASKMEALNRELEEVIRKNDYRFRGEAWGEERNSWLRALQKLKRTRQP